MSTTVQGPIKPEYAPLFAPGFHDVEEGKLDELFIDPFPDPSVRKDLVENFRSLLNVIRGIGVSAEVWLDGSFATRKPDPVDIDIVIYFDPVELQALDLQHQKTLDELADNNKSRMKYKCDLYFALNNRPELRSYWRGWFSFTRTEEPKGIARIFI